MSYCADIRGLMAEANKLHVAAETHRKERGRDQEYRRTWIRQSQIHDRLCDLQRQAAQEFAALNGWRWTERLFSAETLARGGTHSSPGWCYDHRLLDHPLFFRELARPYRTAAIVGQPYNTTPADARELAAKLGLVLHVLWPR